MSRTHDHLSIVLNNEDILYLCSTSTKYIIAIHYKKQNKKKQERLNAICEQFE